MMARASRESRRTRTLEDKSAVDIENDHTSSAHLDTRTSNPSNSERFEGRLIAGMAWKLSRMIDFRKATARPYSSMIQRRVRIDSENAPAVQEEKRMLVVGLVVLVVGVMLCDGQQGIEATAWHKAALELNRRLVVAQVEATQSQIKSTQATAWATYALVAATLFLALSSIIQAVLSRCIRQGSESVEGPVRSDVLLAVSVTCRRRTY